MGCARRDARAGRNGPAPPLLLGSSAAAGMVWTTHLASPTRRGVSLMRPIKVPGFELALWAGAALLALSASSCKKSSPAAEGEGEPATASSSAAVTAREETPPEPEAVKDGP